MDYFTCTSSVGDTSSKGDTKGQLLWWQLSLIGIGCGTIFEESFRFGFFVSLMLVAIVGLVTMVMNKKWKKSKEKKREGKQFKRDIGVIYLDC